MGFQSHTAAARALLPYEIVCDAISPDLGGSDDDMLIVIYLLACAPETGHPSTFP